MCSCRECEGLEHPGPACNHCEKMVCECTEHTVNGVVISWGGKTYNVKGRGPIRPAVVLKGNSTDMIGHTWDGYTVMSIECFASMVVSRNIGVVLKVPQRLNE